MNVINVVVICLGGSLDYSLGTLSCGGGWRSCKRQSHLREILYGLSWVTGERRWTSWKDAQASCREPYKRREYEEN